MKMYTIKDNVAGVYLSPNVFPSDMVFKRAICSAVNGPKGSSLLAEYPEDCAAYYLGDFDDKTGVITPVDPVFLFNCVVLKSVEVVDD